ncbi:hypothetical protein A2W14_04020 [Candidatus Gottesmanbacteria bacterium RBG_16_37_8]|uniref:ATP-grasp domain-containing protein n=1 Tax=Candidatus Gottesmanbacteria bacterium RBG_16_37_8 TaxID=1798371 RepID=A0A1F5YU82_9BACT|nr:MAG: hypothetical protein A2W14_04020 [Candidatus Gottesmanbacteria bacterium RBG_16_37_8]
MAHKRIGLITFSKKPLLTPSDNLLLEPLKKAGFDPLAVPWDKKNVNWSAYNFLILRSCWNYHFNFPLFLNWLDQLEKVKIKILNPVEIVNWNVNKKYLKDLERIGVPIVPTVFLAKGEKVNLKDLVSKRDWQEIVIKPAVGASSYNVLRFQDNEYDKAQVKLNEIVKRSAVLIQPLMKEVIEEGEYSLIFFGREYSHTVLKRPKIGDFRALGFGASYTKIEPDKKLISQAGDILSKIKSDLLYARLDGISQNGVFILIEIELIEPHLFFDLDPQSPTRFVKAFEERITL